ncbi:DUF1989 domain-containing protein [Mycolicibacterium pyrenivorans]|uniref:DUF1989 domain-containing protein n=1 Tax=Mycolicibacterium pyrenivorans TaxID=187102 RepID=UPI0027E2967E|nr:DUF1989 domain-containing protein [Mycolicibacterium pyrenivorans]
MPVGHRPEPTLGGGRRGAPRRTVAARRGWPALNLFYNTAFDARHQLISDEPWSRAGDYVLFRASTDLVCASSACPDDIDAANGWMPTDIHVRVYDSTMGEVRGRLGRALPRHM